MSRVEAIRVVRAMQTAALAQSAALLGLRAQVVPGNVGIGLGSDLEPQQALDLQAELDDAVTTSRNHAEALGHIVEALVRPEERPGS